MNILTTVYLCGLIVSGDASCDLPFSKRCKRNDPNFSQCWRSTLLEVPQYLKNGIPEMGVPPIDPWRSKEKYSLDGKTFAVAHEYMEHVGTKHFEVIDSTVSLTANVITLKLRFPKLHHTCTSLAKGTMLGFQFLGVEGCNEAIADVTIEFMFKGKRFMKKEMEYIDFNNILINVRGKYTNQKFHNIVVGGSATNNRFSIEAEKAEVVFEPLYNECVRSSLGLGISEVIKNIYRQCPLDNLHPLK